MMLFKSGQFVGSILLISLLVGISPVHAKSVLLVWSASEDQPWTAAVEEALDQQLGSNPGEYELYQEHLNYDQLQRLPDPDLWAAAINEKYREAGIDLILGFEFNAGKLIETTRASLLPSAERVNLLGPPKSAVANVSNTNQPSNQLSAIQQLMPNLERVYYISALPAIKLGVQQAITSGAYPFEIILLDNQLSYSELEQALAALPKNSAIVYSVMHVDREGAHQAPAEVLKGIQKQVSAPIFVDFATLMLPGVVGGHTLDATKLAQKAAALILGEAPSNQMLALGQLTVDYAALQQWKIPVERLPEGSIVLNSPVPFIQNHQQQVVYAVIALGVVIALSMVLLYALRLRSIRLRLSEASRESAQAELEFERKLNELNRTATLATTASGIGTFEYDPSKDQMWPSAITAKLLEITPDEDGVVRELSSAMLDRIHPEDSRNLRQSYRGSEANRVELTYRLLNSHGEYRWLHSVSEPAEGPDGTLRIGIIRDITDEKLLNDRLYRAQERMTLALDASHIDLFEVNLETGEALLLAGTSGAHQAGDKFPFIDGLSTYSLPGFTRRRIKEEMGCEKHRIEYTLRTSDGKALAWHLLATGKIYLRDGVNHITIARTDITAIREQQHAAEQSGRENQLALAATGGGIARIKTGTGRTWLSKRAQQIWDTGDLIGDTTTLMAMAQQHHPEDDERVTAEFRKLYSGTEIRPVEYRIKLRSGDYRWIRAHGVQHLDINDDPEILAVFYDITDEKAQMQELIDSRERQSRLFAIIGHELRTPIATIQMMLEQQQVYDLEPFGEQLHQTMQHTLSVLDDLRSVTQPQQQKAQETPAVVYDQLEQTLGSLQSILESKGIRAHFLTDTRVQALCLFDRQALRQMVTNLLKNSALHSGASDLWLTAEATEYRDDRLAVCISVADNGKGIAPDQIERLFEAFSRGNTDADGTGLGLHICRTMAQKLGGTLTYERSPQGGAMFVFNGTFNLAPERQELESEIAETSVVNSAPMAGLRILYAEDQKTLQLLTLTLLKKQGAEVSVADDGVHALEIYDNDSAYDLVLTDIMMPRMDGNALTRALRERGFKGQIVGLTAATIGLETDALLESGADATLSKPVDIKKLVALVTESALNE